MKLIDEWKKFYPLDSSTEWGEPSSLGPDKGIPLAMLVVVGETQMWYPSLYIVAPCAGLDSSGLFSFITTFTVKGSSNYRLELN